MDLKIWLDARRMQMQELAKKIGVTPCTISNYIHGRRKPRVEIARMIEKFTKGKVTIDDLLDNWKEKNRKSKK